MRRSRRQGAAGPSLAARLGGNSVKRVAAAHPAGALLRDLRSFEHYLRKRPTRSEGDTSYEVREKVLVAGGSSTTNSDLDLPVNIDAAQQVIGPESQHQLLARYYI